MKRLRFIAYLLLTCVLAFAACDTGQKNDNNSIILMLLGNDTGPLYNMVRVPVPESGGFTFATGENDDEGNATVTDIYWIADTEVTWKLWNTVYTWATDLARGTNGYTFAQAGGRGGYSRATFGTYTSGHETHPVSMINWRHAMVWCNALTEWYNANNGTEADLDCVYYMTSEYSTPIRYATDSEPSSTEDNPYVKPDAKGFRLPTSNEWELAARYIDGVNWLYGDHASGDESGACSDDGSILGGQSLSTVFGKYAVYAGNSGFSSARVKTKKPNALGLYDLSGNVLEWCFDISPSFPSCRVVRGGNWFHLAPGLPVGLDYGYEPYREEVIIGFRIARTE